VLEVELRLVEQQLRVIDPVTGVPVPLPEELDLALDAAEARADQETRERQVAEARAAEAEARAAKSDEALQAARRELERLRRRQD
jgi:hypothetical protein